MKINHLKVFKKKAVLHVLAMCFPFLLSQAQENFPYDEIPLTDGAFNTTININTLAGTSPFNNLLLGSNVDFNTSIARILLSRAPLFTTEGVLVNSRAANQGFNSLEGQQFIADNDPVVLRFPQGVFANTYHWERVVDANGQEIAAADSRHILDPLIINGKVISKHDSPLSVRIGYPALRTIFDSAERIGKPLDLLTVLSIIGNDADSNLRRWESMINDGHDVRDMELGNEFFWRSQRSGTITNEAQWVARANMVVENIRNRASELGRIVKFGIPLSYRVSQQTYNDLISADESFFDAIVVHRYVSEQKEAGNRPEDLTAASLRNLVSASTIMDQSLSYCKTQVSEDKNSIWLTEWGVSGSEVGGIGASFLGAADVYSHIITNNSRLEVERINWFSSVGANAQYTVEGTANNIQIGKTGYGNVYSILRDNLRDSNMYNDVLFTSPDLTLNGAVQEAKPIHALAVRRSDGTPRLIVTNKTNATARININIDSTSEDVVNYIASGFRWDSLIATNSIPYSDEQASVNAILVPPYSVIKVDMSFGEGEAILSTSDIQKSETGIKLFPNPTSSIVNISLFGINSADVFITDMLGKVVIQTKTKQTKIQLNTTGMLRPGVYLVRIIAENNKTFIKKMVIN